MSMRQSNAPNPSISEGYLSSISVESLRTLAMSQQTHPEPSHESKVLCSFAPALMLSALERGMPARPPISQQYQAVALFAVSRADITSVRAAKAMFCAPDLNFILMQALRMYDLSHVGHIRFLQDE